MPQLRFMQSPQGLALIVGVRMPNTDAGRWSVAVTMQDADNRDLGRSSWSLSHGDEKADIGHWMRSVYDSWFNGDPYHVLDAAERNLKVLRS